MEKNRIGLFTHRIYTQEEYDNLDGDIGECCLVLPSSIKTEDEARPIVGARFDRCYNCFGCPESRKERGRVEGTRV